MTRKELADLENEREAILSSRIAMARARAYAIEKRADERRAMFGTAEVAVLPTGYGKQTTFQFDGLTLSIADWASRTGISLQVLTQRLDRGCMSIAEALTLPVARPGHSPRSTRNRPTLGRKAAQHSIDGVDRSLGDWCVHYGADLQATRRRLAKGVPLLEALTMPKGARIKRHLAGSKPGAPSELSTIGQ